MTDYYIKNLVGWLGGKREPSPEAIPINIATSIQDITVSKSDIDNDKKESICKNIEENSDVLGENTQNIKILQDNEKNINKEELDSKFFQKDLQEVSDIALSSAKDIGNYLLAFGKTASDQVIKSVKQIKETVEEKTIIGDFSREQEKFKAERQKTISEAGLPVWVGYNEEEAMKKQILALSLDKRNLLRNPPVGVNFVFDYDVSYPIALAMLEEDSNLKEIRFELVPKKLNEETFWRNYFYRVSLIKQSTQLTTLAQMTGVKFDTSKEPIEINNINEAQPRTSLEDRVSESMISEPVENEFVSDTFQSDNINDDELVKELNQLVLSSFTNLDSKTEIENEKGNLWEADSDTDEIEKEILMQLEADKEKEN